MVNVLNIYFMLLLVIYVFLNKNAYSNYFHILIGLLLFGFSFLLDKTTCILFYLFF